MLALIIILTAILSVFRLRTLIMNAEDDTQTLNGDDASGFGSSINNAWNNIILSEYVLPLTHYCVSVSYSIYTGLTLINVAVFILKYVPTGFYMYKLIKDVYVSSRKRIKQKQLELDEIQLQIEMVNKMLSARDVVYKEQAEQLQRSAEKLRIVRARVRDVIAADDTLLRALENAAKWDADHDEYVATAPQEQDRELIEELLKEMKYDNLTKSMRTETMERGEHAQTDPNTPVNSIYSSVSDVDVRQDCRVKIVKVTNVYKIAYLKHYIKQKRLRRANKQAQLKKKMENIKDLLEDWQNTLNMVINSKLTILNIDQHPIDVASQEAMGDYTKPRGSNDSDSDLRNSWPDMYYDETYNYEDGSDTGASRECYDSQDYGDGSYPVATTYSDVRGKSPNMMSIIEETNSQLAIEEIKSEADEEYECRDVMAL